jgi:hypothetical protein
MAFQDSPVVARGVKKPEAIDRLLIQFIILLG